MKSVLAVIGLLLWTGPVLAETTRTVKPEFHPLTGQSAVDKRSLANGYKAAGAAAPVRFESRAVVDSKGEVHVNCEELAAHGHDHTGHDR